ncbi:MAG: FliI/YscN family ATPase, partial [Planctomycetes bacterium]|nr:FliI/YscN family ATPase [Planctomycetota bacterium]
ASGPVGPELLGRVINGFGEPIDDKGPLLCQVRRSLGQERLKPLGRKRIDTVIGTGIRAIDALMTCGRGQRMGIFSGPGVGKSVLLGMIARYSSSDVSVIALVGERGREVREFIEKDLGPEGLARSVVVVSTSDEPAPLRVRASKTAAMIAESFRDQGKDVLLLMDSITRVAMAQRQIGLAVGEPPATKGYTPSVFSLLAGLVERSGMSEQGSITGFYTVLVEGDDLSEPISDAMRGLLDGHVWLSRELGNKGHYPAIDVLESVSRVMVDVVDEQHQSLAHELIRLVAVYRDIEDLVNIGAYTAGSNAEFDLAVKAHGLIDAFLRQGLGEGVEYRESVAELERLMGSLREGEGMGQRSQPVEVQSEPAKTESRRDVSPELARMMAGV